MYVTLQWRHICILHAEFICTVIPHKICQAGNIQNRIRMNIEYLMIIFAYAFLKWYLKNDIQLSYTLTSNDLHNTKMNGSIQHDRKALNQHTGSQQFSSPTKRLFDQNKHKNWKKGLHQKTKPIPKSPKKKQLNRANTIKHKKSSIYSIMSPFGAPFHHYAIIRIGPKHFIHPLFSV